MFVIIGLSGIVYFVTKAVANTIPVFDATFAIAATIFVVWMSTYEIEKDEEDEY